MHLIGPEKSQNDKIFIVCDFILFLLTLLGRASGAAGEGHEAGGGEEEGGAGGSPAGG